MNRMGSAAESRERGQGEAEWIPMAEGLWMFEIGKPAIELSGFKNDDGTDKYRVSIPLQLTPDEYERAKEEMEPSEGRQISGRTKYRVGLGAKYPLGFYRDDKYVSTKLADFICAAFGSKQVSKARKYLEAGGGPDFGASETFEDQIAALEDWLGWLEGCQVYGSISHSEDKKTPGKFWANFGGPLPVGSMPGQPAADYQAFGLGKLRAITTGGELPSRTREDDPAGQGIAEGVAAREEARQPELVGAAAREGPKPREYSDLFPDDDS